MLTPIDLVDLAADFASWGKEAVMRVGRLTRKHGVLCSSEQFSDGKRG